MIVRESHPRRREGVLKQRASGTVILLDLDEGQYFALNEVGGRVWELCDGTRSVSEVASLLSLEYEVSPETLLADLVELLTDLADEKLVVAGQEMAGGTSATP